MPRPSPVSENSSLSVVKDVEPGGVDKSGPDALLVQEGFHFFKKAAAFLRGSALTSSWKNTLCPLNNSCSRFLVITVFVLEGVEDNEECPRPSGAGGQLGSHSLRTGDNEGMREELFSQDFFKKIQS